MKLHPFSIAILAVFVAGAVSGCNEAGPNGVAPQVSAVQLPGDAAADAVVADAGQEDAARAGQEQAAEPVERPRPRVETSSAPLFRATSRRASQPSSTRSSTKS